MILEWEGWRYDEAKRELSAPWEGSIAPTQARVFAALLRARGATVSRRVLAGVLEPETRSSDPYNVVGMTIHKLKARLRELGAREPGIGTRHGCGYRLLSGVNLAARGATAAEAEAIKRRAIVEALLVDELEATRPHARAIARKVEAVYAGGGE